MRRPHYWRRPRASAAPSNILVYDTETWHGDRAAVLGGELQTLRLGVALAYRMERGRRTRVEWCRFTTADQFWVFVRSRLLKSRPLWILAHNIAYDLGVVGGWSVLTSDSFEASKICVSGGVFYVSGYLDGFRIVLCDTGNYYRCSLASIGRSLGLPKMDMPDQSAPDDAWYEYCRRDVEVTAAAVDSLVSFVRREELGPWQPTVAGLAFSAYRSRFMRHKVLVHAHRESLEVERAAYYGGVVDTPRIGPVPTTPVWECDVCSMYPSVCLGDLPARLVGYSDRLSLSDLLHLTDDHMVAAEVAIRTSDRTYPVRLRDGTYYPVGEYRTTLPPPELVDALRRGHVTHVYRAAWYRPAKLFKDYMLYFTDRKSEYRASGDEAWSAICKMYANSLYGKTGQRSDRWTEWGEEAMTMLEDRYGLRRGSLARYAERPPVLYQPEVEAEIPGVPEMVRVRDIFGVVEVCTGGGESRDSCPIIAATVTSYARLLLRRYQEIAGPGEWYYSDTDSVWVSETGLARLEDAGCVASDRLGLLSVKGSHRGMVVYGPKDYETDSIRRLKGVRANAERIEDGGWMQLQFPSAIVQLRDGTADGVYVRRVVKRLARRVTKVRVLPDGTTRPLVFPSECPSR